jgi:transposase InsO family protein
MRESALGLNAGPVPPRVEEHVRAGLLDLVDHAIERGWSARRAAGVLGLAAEDLLEAADARASAALRKALLDGDRDAVGQLTTGGTVPLLVAISDHGLQMRSVSTREFLAGLAIAQQFGRPHTPEDQVWIETLFGHVKGEWPHLEKSATPASWNANSTAPKPTTTACECTPASVTSPPTTNTPAAAKASAKPAATGSPQPAPSTA